MSFKFIHRSAVASWPGIFNGKVHSEIVLKPGFTWYDGYSTSETLSFVETPKDTPDGKYYEKEVSGFVPGDKLQLVDLMDQMDGHYFVVQIRDTNNQVRLVGSHADLLTFWSTFNTGTGRADTRGYSFKFIGNGIFRAPVYL